MFKVFKTIAIAYMLFALSFSVVAANKEIKMSGPAQNGVLIYSSKLNYLAEFYEQLFGMRVTKETRDFISLDKDGFSLIIHVPPFELPQESFSPIKLFLSVQNMDETRKEAVRMGGEAFEGEWKNPIFKVSNIADREGNHIQIREFIDASKG
uniref:VOC family protein n=1 Tax=Ningiella ruwaisensis TaxID=2364274 RepID=UPI00109F5547|nr:VOC family protein [Ningiella ruwaisensis]